jgi:protein SCO1/2
LQPIAKDYGLYAKKNTEAGSAAGYLVDHTVVTYLIDKQGQLRVFYPFGVQPSTIANDVETMLKEEA